MHGLTAAAKFGLAMTSGCVPSDDVKIGVLFKVDLFKVRWLRVTATGARTLPISFTTNEWCGTRSQHDSQGDTRRATPTAVVRECICGGDVNGFAICFRSSVFGVVRGSFGHGGRVLDVAT
jgi:hypothetical protein